MTNSSTVVHALLLAVAVFVAGCAGQGGGESGRTGETPDWRLISATETANERHFIVTIALEKPEALQAAARRLEADHAVELVAEWPLSSIDVHCFVFRAEDGADLDALERELRRANGVRTVQRMRQFSLLGESYSDEYLSLQRSLVAINALKVHRYSTGRDVRVAVVDTGIDTSHPDLAAQVATAKDFVADAPETRSEEIHGTAMAGVIAADGTNGRGIVGVAPDARILALRACWQADGQGHCSSFSLARAINFAIVKDVDVLNLSLAGPYDPLLAELIEAALARGLVVVAALGDPVHGNFPASMQGVIAAGAVAPGETWTGETRTGEIGAQGSAPPLPAPGVDVITTTAGGGYDFFSGSSVAAAHVSGVAALLLEREPNLTPSQLHAALVRSVRDDPAEQGGPVLDSCWAVSIVENDDTPGPC